LADAKGKILIVDDEPSIRELVKLRLTDDGYACDLAEDAEIALSMLSQAAYDGILSDVNMPGISGIDMLRRIRLTDEDVAVIIMTGAPDLASAVEAMKLGAHDHLSKPLNLDMLTLTVDRAVEKKRLVVQNREYQRNLESMVRERTKQLNDANSNLRSLFIGSIKALAQALEAKDEYTQGHSARVAEESVRIARYLSLSEAEIQSIWIAGFLHDIGKIGVKESVLNKPGELDAMEWESVKEHPVLAARILDPIDELRDVIEMVKHHHERFDGGGYPDGLAGSDIPLGARILSVADAYDALTSKRPYREPMTPEQAIQIFKDGAGTQFDPVIVEAFLSATDKRESGERVPYPAFGSVSLHDAKQVHPEGGTKPVGGVLDRP
jgi:putative nucleotidyltransferase with HDIG domain